MVAQVVTSCGELTTRHILTISPDYVADWDEWSGARELIQNALDQSEQNGEEPIVKWCDGTLTIGVANCELSPKTLLLGNTTKRGDKEQRGQFGEGYKLALLVFARGLYDIRIRTGAEEWTASIVKNDEFDSEVLQVERKPAPQVNGVFFTVQGITEPTWRMIELRYLPGAKGDLVLSDRPGELFSGGLFIRHQMGYRYGYNFSPSRLVVGRDRDVISGFDLDYATSQVWQATAKGSVSEVYEMLKSDARDTRYLTYVPASTAKLLVKKYEQDFGEGTTPVKDQKELDDARGQGLRATIIPDALRSIVKSVKKFMYYDQTTPGYKMKAFAERFKEGMNLDAYEELELLVAASQSWRS